MLVLAPTLLRGQVAGWTSHTPFRSVDAMTASETAIWVATTGGIFSYEIDSGEIRTFTTTDGLYGIDVRAMSYDPRRDAIWIGYADGAVDRLDVQNGEIRTMLDIQRADQFPSRVINQLRAVGDTVYVATNFGVVLFNPTQLEVIDSYSNIGTLNPATPINDVLPAPLPDGRRGIWVASSAGLASAWLGSVNLREPSQWTVDSQLPTDVALSLTWYLGRIHVGTSSDAYSRKDDGSWTKLGLSGDEVLDLITWNDELVAVEPFSLVFLNSAATRRRVGIGYQGEGLEINYSRPRAVVEAPDGILWAGDEVEGALALPGIESADGQYWSSQRVVPDGPFFGLFTDLVFDGEGNLWASGTRGNGTGFYKFDGQSWVAYTERFVPELEGRDTFDFIHYSRSGSGSIWVGSEGWASAVVDADNTVTVYDQTNSTLRVATGTSGYVRVRGIASEADGSIWMINQFSPTPLNFRDETTGDWTGFLALRGDGIPTSLDYNRIFVDSFGQKWILALNGGGLIVWDTGATPTNTSDDRLKYLRGRGSGGRGLPDENITSWAEDRTGRVWIGTQRGLGIFFVPSLVISNDPNAYEAVWPIAEDRSGFLLRDLFVNDLAVDAADRKWIASTTGAWLIDPDGTKVLKHFTVENSPLFSDDVVAVAVDNRTGKVYFATERGLLSYQDDPIEPAAEAADLFVYPNPVIAASDGSLPTISIEGLVAATDVRITSVDGRVIATMEGRGGRVRWDGRDENGQYVPSGVYLVIARGLNEEGVAHGKIAVVH